MARPKTSLLRRVLVQTDCAFWCIHDHPDVIAYLGLPTLVAQLVAAFTLIGIWRISNLPDVVGYLIGGLLVPFLALLIFTALPLPCAVFAWKTACGETASVRDCFAWCFARRGRLFSVLFRLSLLWLVSLPLLGIPLLWFWPRTCLAPLVALFEDERRIFRRSGRVLREELSVPVVGALHAGMGLILGGLVVLPRLLVATPMLGAHLLDASWRPMIVDHLWIFETITLTILLTAVAVNWWISITLVYHDVRWVREGEDLKRRIALLRARLAPAGGPA